MTRLLVASIFTWNPAKRCVYPRICPSRRASTACRSTNVLRVRRREAPPGWVVTASVPEEETGLRPVRLAAALGLSPGAAGLLAALIAGETLNAFCARKGMSRNTAKYHLRDAFTATGTNRQADLVRRATAIARDLAF